MNDAETATPPGAVVVALAMALGYVGVYLARKNLSVAVPLLQDAFDVGKADVGVIASASTIAYMMGKFLSGPLVDRLGGRAGFLGALAGVALFGALGAFAPGIGALAFLYSLNRFSGAAGWNAMMKLTSTWFPPRRLGTAVAALSLSYVLGGIAATLFAKQVYQAGGGWRAVMGVPSVAVLLLLVLAAALVRNGPLRELPAGEGGQPEAPAGKGRGALWSNLKRLMASRQFQTICVLSFTLTLIREAMSTWGVDFLVSVQSGPQNLGAAALQSVAFDLAGAVPIVLMGITYDRLAPVLRRWLVFGILLGLSVALALLTTVGKSNPGAGVALLALVGLLLYGPYSILGGVVSIETGGSDLAGTATGVVDGIGYLAAILAGQTLGEVLDRWGYPMAFTLLAGLTLASALCSLCLRARPPVVAADAVPA